MVQKLASLNLDALSSLDKDKRQAYLGIVDQLRELGVGEDLSLPQVSAPARSLLCSKTDPGQLVVVGDQSSGKSSLLEGLTGLSFPVASDLCTRHATQIVLRRTTAHEAAIRVSIISGPSSISNTDEKARLDKFARCIKENASSADEFSGILDEVSVACPL
jgi:hypothetical protein